jgi:hypothetical protein
MDAIALVVIVHAWRRGNMEYVLNTLRAYVFLAVGRAQYLGDAQSMADAERVVTLYAAVRRAAALERRRVRPFLRTPALPVTTWQILYARLKETKDDLGFIHYCGVDYEVFKRLLRGFRERMEKKSGRPRRLDAAATLGMTLHSLCARTAITRGLEVHFGVGKSIVSRTIDEGMELLLEVLKEDALARVEWPSDEVRVQHHNETRTPNCTLPTAHTPYLSCRQSARSWLLQ